MLSGKFIVFREAPQLGDSKQTLCHSVRDVEQRVGGLEGYVAGIGVEFAAEAEAAMGGFLGKIALLAPRSSFPLGFHHASRITDQRLALVGDSAHAIHPIAGQGLNLGFRDAAALAETIVDAHRLGLDIGSLEVLRRYEIWRRYDTWQMGMTTDLLNRMFSNDFGPMRAIRDLGLGIVDRLPRLKKLFIGEAAGFGGELPKLMRGEAL